MNVLQQSHSLPQSDHEVTNISVGELLSTIAKNTPEQKALIECHVDGSDGREISYQELVEDSKCVARWLLQYYEPGERLAVWSPNSLDWFLLQLGMAEAGITLVTVNPAFKKSEAEYILNQSKVSAVFTVKEYRDIPLLDTAQQLSDSSTQKFAVYDIDESMGDILEQGLALQGRVELNPVSPDAACMIQYTSGTTGNPKGVVLSHRAVVNYAKFSESGLELPAGSTWVNFMPMFHTGGCIYMALGCLWNGGIHLLLDAFDPEFVLKTIEKYKAHFLWCVPTMYFSMLEHEDFDKFDKSSLIVIASGATTVPPDLVSKLEDSFTGEFVMLFGQTECGMVCQTSRGDTLEHKSTTVGKAMPHVEIRIVNTDSGEVQDIGQPGEICVRSCCVLDGYFDLPEATAKTVDQERWLHTGDVGVMDADGYCKITGRIKDMIIRGGENIFPREIEDVLCGHDEVMDSAVFGVPDRKWGEQVAVSIRLKPGSSITDDELMEYLRSKIARHKVPRIWQRVDSFPMTASGKVKKFEMRDNYIKKQEQQ